MKRPSKLQLSTELEEGAKGESLLLKSLEGYIFPSLQTSQHPELCSDRLRRERKICIRLSQLFLEL